MINYKMKKLFFGLLLLIVTGCQSSRSDISEMRITESSPDHIRIMSTAPFLDTGAGDFTKLELAGAHCAKYGKYYFFYASDFNRSGTNYVCGTSPPRSGEVILTNFVYGAQTQAVNTVDNKKTCKDFGYKEGTDKFADCMLELTKLSARQNHQSPTGNNGVSDAMREANQIERAKVLLDLGKTLRTPATPQGSAPTPQTNCRVNPVNGYLNCW
jgi:hypothetical protein